MVCCEQVKKYGKMVTKVGQKTRDKPLLFGEKVGFIVEKQGYLQGNIENSRGKYKV